MVRMVKKLAVKVRNDVEEKYVPRDIKKDKWYPVIGYVSRDYEKIIENKTKQETFIAFLVINDKSGLSQITSKNCIVCIDNNPKA